MSRLIIFGDIHGCLDEWRDLINKTGATSEDRLVAVGDLIAKGPHSFETIKFAQSLPNLKCILGNHEMHFLKAWKSQHLEDLTKDYQKKALKEFGNEFESCMRWINTWPTYLEFPECIVIHGGLRPDIPIEKQKREDLCNLRQLDNGDPWHEHYQGKKPVIYGHWARQGLTIKDNSIGLDSGCVYGKELSAVVFPERKIFQVKARKAYVEVSSKD